MIGRCDMVFQDFMKMLHSIIGNKALYEFIVDLFDSSTDSVLSLSPDSVRNWFRSGNRNQSFMKYLDMDNFNDFKFNTFLKARSMGSWRALQTVFREANVGNPESLINFVTDNHDKFIESLEWQFKSILRIPIVLDSGLESLTLAIGADGNSAVEYVDISDALLTERLKDIKVHEKWIVVANFQLELLIMKRFPEIFNHGLRKGIRYSYFCSMEAVEGINAFEPELAKFTNNARIIPLPTDSPGEGISHVPKWGYSFYITDEPEGCRGYMYNKFHEMKEYRAFRMNTEEARDIIARLRKLSGDT